MNVVVVVIEELENIELFSHINRRHLTTTTTTAACGTTTGVDLVQNDDGNDGLLVLINVRMIITQILVACVITFTIYTKLYHIICWVPVKRD